MKVINILRGETSDEGTFGLLTTDGFHCHTGELVWNDNEKGKSCIPAGTYQCVWHNSPSKGWVYMVQDVPERDNVLIHVANYCGTPPTYKSDLLGCIGLGLGFGQLLGQKAITSSGLAIQQFNALMNKEPFTLNIRWIENVGEGNT